jgi:formate dehydrogenase-N alpha subunit
VASLAATFGRGAMTNGWVDIRNADVILCMGGNPAENHPCGFKWAIEAKKTRGAKIVAVDPRFTRTAAVADLHAPIRSGSDIAFLLGMIRYAIENRRYHDEYVKIHTNAPYVIGDEFAYDDGLFSGFSEERKEYDKSSWAYAADTETKGYKVDPTLQDPRCVFQLLKKHVERYTPEMVSRICGVPESKFLEVAEIVTSTGTPDRAGTIMYALGWTQHSTGVQMIRAAAMLQLLLGNVGRPGGGVNALRGHSNIQGATDMGGNTEILPGYLKTPIAKNVSLESYLKTNTPGTLNNQHWASMNYWQNYPKFMVSLLKSAYGQAATKENDFGYDWMPKLDGNYSWAYMFDDMYRGDSKRAGGTEPGPEGLFTFGMNPVGVGPNTAKVIGALSKLKWLVVVENVEIETAQFWRAPKEYGTPAASGDRDRGLPAPRDELRREGRLDDELRPLGTVEVEGRAAARDREERPGDPRADRARGEGALPQGRRRPPRADRSALVELHEPRGARSRRGPEGDQRQGPRGSPGSEGRLEDREDGRTAARELRTAPRRRHDDVRQLALHGLLHRKPATTRRAARTPIPPASACSTAGRSRGPRTGA